MRREVVEDLTTKDISCYGSGKNEHLLFLAEKNRGKHGGRFCVPRVQGYGCRYFRQGCGCFGCGDSCSENRLGRYDLQLIAI